MQRQQRSRISSSDESTDSSASRVLIQSAQQTSEHTLPISIIPSSLSSTRRTIDTQTIEVSSKSTPSFAETQLLSVYYPHQKPTNVSTNDKCVFVEQQDRQPVRYRTAYDPLSSTNEHIEESRSSYEEYNVHVEEQKTRTSSSSSSSVTTVIAQNEECDSDNTSRSSLDAVNIQSPLTNNQRISSWPPVPDDILPLDNQNGRRPSRVQFAENLVHVIPISTTTSLTDESMSSQANNNEKSQLTDIDSRLIHEQLQRVDYLPKNQSKWIKNHLDNSDIQTKATSNHVGTLRSMFERNTSTINNSTNQIQTEEKPSKYGTEIRFHIKDLNTPTIHHAEPAKVIPHTNTSVQDERSTPPFNIDQIRQITGKQFKSINEIGRYLQDGYTWQWNEKFWLSLTTSQRDQLTELEKKFPSADHSLNQSDSDSTEIKRFKSTIHITGAGAWQQHKPQITPSDNIKDEKQPSMSIFGSTPNSTYSKNSSQESLVSSITLTTSKKSDNQITNNESGYNSPDDQSRFRPYSSTIIEETSNDSQLSYEQFIYDYLTTHARHIRSNDGTLILFVDGQQIHMSNIRLPSSNENLTLATNIYLDAIDLHLSPFETESDQLVIFLHGETIFLPADRWLYYREKYNKAEWIGKLKRVNRNIPAHLIPIIEEWLCDHATVSLETHELNVDGLTIPLIGRLGLHILDSYQIQQLKTNYWNDILKYLIRTGYVSYNFNQKLIHIAHSELDARRLLKSPSPELLERLIKHLQTLNHIHFQNNTLILTENFQFTDGIYSKSSRR